MNALPLISLLYGALQLEGKKELSCPTISLKMSYLKHGDIK